MPCAKQHLGVMLDGMIKSSECPTLSLRNINSKLLFSIFEFLNKILFLKIIKIYLQKFIFEMYQKYCQTFPKWVFGIPT